MGEHICLTPDEMRELTDTPHKTKQIDFLRKNRIPFFLTASGRPKVVRSVLEGQKTKEPPRKKWEMVIPESWANG